MINAIESQERQGYNSPTALNLLHFRTPNLDGTRIAEFRQKLQRSLLLERDHEKTGKFLEDLLDQKDRRIQRIGQAQQETTESASDLESSIACSKVFLAMREAFPDMLPSDFMAAYKASVNLNLQLTSFVKKKSEGAQSNNAILMSTKENFAAIRKLVENSLDNIPSSFSQSRDRWGKILLHDNNFTHNLKVLINPSIILTKESTKLSIATRNKFEILFRGTTPEGLPDWLSEDLKEPSKDTVQEELEEDKQELDKGKERFKGMNMQKQYIGNLNSSKFSKTMNWLSHVEETTFSDKISFADFVLFLHTRRKSFRAFENVRYQVQSRNRLKPEQRFENMIKEYSEKEDLLESPEPLALFIERLLINAEIIKNPSDPIGDSFVNFFTDIINNPGDKEIENKDKKVREAIKYGIKPILRILNQEEIDYIREFVQSSQGENAESFIWELSDVLASKFKANPHANPDHTIKSVINEIKKFTGTFLRKSWEWTYDNLTEELSRTDETKQKSLEQRIQIDLVIPSEKTEEKNGKTSTEIETVKDAILELAEGNLSGWHILYSTDKSTNPKHLIEVPGTTLEQRERELEGFFQIEGTPPSIKISSIINTLDHLPTVPETIEWLKMRQTVNGEVFKKVKRGKGRIFYHMSPQEKKIIFFYVQKKAWSYRF